MVFARLRLAARNLPLRFASPLALLVILIATAAVYAQVTRFDFVSWDDPVYVTTNAQVQGGLSLSSRRCSRCTRSASRSWPG